MDRQEEKKIQTEMRTKQKFTIAGAIGRQASGAMKGASPIPASEQAIMALHQWIDHHLIDGSGALKSILKRQIKAQSDTIEQHLDAPLTGLAHLIEKIVEKESRLHEFVRRVDVRWGELYMERPHFQQPGQPAHPDDEYTHASVERDLRQLLDRIGEEMS